MAKETKTVQVLVGTVVDGKSAPVGKVFKTSDRAILASRKFKVLTDEEIAELEAADEKGKKGGKK